MSMKNQQLMKRLLWIGVAVVAVVISLPLLAASPVSWEPSKLEVTVPNASTSTVEVSFTADKDLASVVVRIVPELTPFMSVEPSELGNIGKGETRTLTLLLAVPPETEPQSLDGTLQLRHDGKSAKNYSKPLPVELSIEPIDLPPDPGEEGKATLEGIDSDGDGLRDDIQRYIALEYWDEPLVQQGLRQYAFPLQDALIESGSEDLALLNEHQMTLATECMRSRFDFDKVVETTDQLIAQALNTDERSRSYIEYDRQLSGHVFADIETSESHCTN